MTSFLQPLPQSLFLPSTNDANIPYSPAGSSPHFRAARDGSVCVFAQNAPWSAIWPSEALSYLSLQLLPLEPCSVNLLVCAPQTWIWSIFCLKESIVEHEVPKHCNIYYLQEGGEIKRQLEKSVLLNQAPCWWWQYKISNIWGENKFQCSSVINPCCCIHLLLPSFRPFHLLVPWCFILQSPAPAGSLMWTSPVLFALPLRKHDLFLLGNSHLGAAHIREVAPISVLKS